MAFPVLALRQRFHQPVPSRSTSVVIASRVSLALFVSAGATLLLAGCAPSEHGTAAQHGTAAPRSTLASDKLTISATPAYQAATASYRRGDMADALSRLDAIAKMPSLSNADRTFLAHQQAICRDHLSGLIGKSDKSRENNKSGASSSLAAATATRHAHVPTAADADCGPRALLLVCQRLHVPASLDTLRKTAGTTGTGTSLDGLMRAAKSVGLTAEGVQMDGAALANLDADKTPAIGLAWVDGNHYVAVLAVHGDKDTGTATIHDPNKGADEDVSLATGPTGLLERSGGILLLLSRSHVDTHGGAKTLAATTTAGRTPM